jgi:Na+/H+ antiporter NhaD/arsenite permease-like protein
MVVAWMTLPAYGVPPELVAWCGAAIALGLFLARRRRRADDHDAARTILARALDAETTLFLFALFFMVGVVRRTGVFHALAGGLLALPVGPGPKLVAFLCVAGLVTGLFSAGPSMAALLEVAHELTRTLPAPAVYVGLAMSVCAGSSLFLTAATSGPLAQAMVERAKLRGPDGEPIHFGFGDFLPVGLLAFVLILGVALTTGLLLAR